jgi:hypothetical protein
MRNQRKSETDWECKWEPETIKPTLLNNKYARIDISATIAI